MMNNALASYSDQNLILTGYVGPEMNTLTRQIAAYMKLPFVSFEARIAENLDLPIEQIRAYYGETRLKAIEMEIMTETLLRRSSVIYISGRTLVHADHFARLHHTGPVVCLVVKLDALLQRLHVMMGARYHNPSERALALGDIKREWAVRKLEGIIEMDVTSMETPEILERVSTVWREHALLRA